MTGPELLLSLRCPAARAAALVALRLALAAEHGNLVHTARRLDVSHRALARWLAQDADVKRLAAEARATARATTLATIGLALAAEHGHLGRTARRLGVSRSALAQRMARDADVQRLVDAARGA